MNPGRSAAWYRGDFLNGCKGCKCDGRVYDQITSIGDGTVGYGRRESMHIALNRRTFSLFLIFVALPTMNVGPAQANDERIWAALKEGGKVILMRHTHVDVREGIGLHVPGNCAAEVNLSGHGVEQAKRIANAFRDHGILVGNVLSSPYCRCMDTGRLAFGRATAVSFLMPPGVVSDSQAAKNSERALTEVLNHHGPSNKVMITHDLNMAQITLEPADPGEFFVLQPNGADFKEIGKIQIDAR